jgi:hypothetical protein
MLNLSIEELVRWSVWLSLLLYTAAMTRMLCRKRGRGLWTLAWLAYLLHVAAAFHFVHHWSHAAAMEHTRQVGGFGEGIFVNHLFTLLWTADVASWWLWPAWHAQRSRWIDGLLHAFMLFVIVNAAVVFAEGPMRWAGVAMLAWLAGAAWYARRSAR